MDGKKDVFAECKEKFWPTYQVGDLLHHFYIDRSASKIQKMR
jgi:hypothetical protein